MKEEKLVIGRIDKIDLPEFGLHNISAKVDTGAYTSSIHSAEIKETGKNKKTLTFRIIDPHTDMMSKKVVTEHYTQRTIRNSFGISEKRFVITTVVSIFGQEFETEFSLSDRARMKHPVLLGRKFLNPGFMVDVSKMNISYKAKTKSKKKK